MYINHGEVTYQHVKNLSEGYSLSLYSGNDGELRLGIRRAAQLKNGTPFSAPCSQSLDLGKLAAVANAVSTKSVFHIYYNPRCVLLQQRIVLYIYIYAYNNNHRIMNLSN